MSCDSGSCLSLLNPSWKPQRLYIPSQGRDIVVDLPLRGELYSSNNPTRRGYRRTDRYAYPGTQIIIDSKRRGLGLRREEAKRRTTQNEIIVGFLGGL